MTYGTAGMPGNQRQIGAPKDLGKFPVVGNGLGGLPVRTSGPPPLPVYAVEDGVLRMEFSNPVWSFVYRKHSAGVPQLQGTITQTIATIDNNTELPQKTMGFCCLSGNGLVAYLSLFNTSTNEIWIRRYSRADLNSNFFYRTEFTTTGTQSIGNVTLFSSVDGAYLFTSQSNYTSNTEGAMVLSCSDTGMSVIHKFSCNTGALVGVSIQHDVRSKKIYYIVRPTDGGVSQLGYLDCNTNTIVGIDSGVTLDTKIGVNLDNTSRWGFANKSKSFFVVGVNPSRNAVLCTFNNTGVLSSQSLFVPPTTAVPPTNGVNIYPQLFVDRSDNFFICPSGDASGNYGTTIGWKNTSTGAWTWDNSYFTSGQNENDFGISPSGAYIVRRYGGSQMHLAAITYTGTSFSIGSTITTLNWTGRATCAFATGTGSSFNRE